MPAQSPRRDQSTRYPGVYLRDGVLYYRFWNEQGKKERVRFGVGSPKAAHLARLEAMERVALIRSGQLDPRDAERADHERAPVLEHVREYINVLKQRGRSAKHVDRTHANLKAWVNACQLRTLVDVRAEVTVQWLNGLGVAARTRNYYRASVLAFCRWAADNNRVLRNPCPSSLIPRKNEDADRRRLPRVMTPEEFNRLIETTTPERRAFYLLVGMTGLRWREAARIEWSEVDLEAGTITVRAGWSKTGREATLPLLDRVRDALAEIKAGAGAMPGVRVFRAQPVRTTWLRDLDRAGIVATRDGKPVTNVTTGYDLIGYVDERGRMLHKGCLRLSFNTWMARSGVPLAIRQRLMRHSSPALTAITYDDAGVEDLRAAASALGPHMVPERSRGAKQMEAETPVR
jgi:integrase